MEFDDKRPCISCKYGL